jgi:predicted Ser/Thr protein kinase
MKGEKVLYCFTLDPLGLDKKDFRDWKNVIVEPIPQKILDVYKQIYEY